MARLDAASRLRLVLVSGPAGSGKTTALTQWFRQGRRRRQLVWLSLAAETASAPELAHALLAALGEAAAPDPVPRLRERLAAQQGEVVVVVDDFHRLAGVADLRQVDDWLRGSAPGVHWVLAGRGQPELNLSAWRLLDQLDQLDAADMALDAAQVQALAARLAGPVPSAEQAQRLVERTAGWAAGVKLALRAARSAATTDAWAMFDGRHADLVAYLDAEVLRQQVPALQDFLLATCIVDVLEGELCDALTGLLRSQGVLDRLDRAGLFVRPLDERRLQFRYHPLFREFLLARLAEDPDRRVLLHTRASRWYAAQGRLGDALVHAFETGDEEACAELVERFALRWPDTGEVAAVLQWSERLPRAGIVTRPGLAIACASCLLLSRRFDAARALLADVAAARRVPARELRRLHRWIDQLSGHARGGAEPELPAADDASPALRGMHLTADAYALLCADRYDAAWRRATRACELLAPASPYGYVHACSVAALAERARGEFRAGARRVEQMFERVRGGPRGAAWAGAATALAYVRYEANRLDEAAALCEQALPFLEGAGAWETLLLAHVTLSRARAAAGDAEGAAQLLDRVHGLLEDGGDARFLGHVCHEKVRLWLAVGEPGRARRCADEFGLDRRVAEGAWRTPRVGDEGWERLGLAQALLLIEDGLLEEAEAVLAVVREGVARVGHVHRLLAADAALCACLWARGERDAALQRLQQALVLARGQAPSRSWFDDNPGFAALLYAALEHLPLRRLMPASVLRVFGAALGATPRVPGPRSALAGQALTPREREVLALVARGLDNRQIAEYAGVALTTVKWHVKHIFAKLEADNRVAALVRARELQLLR